MQRKLIRSKEEDASHQKQASQYARSLIEASLDPLVAISPEGKITDMNLATVNIIGMSREQLTGTDFFDYFTNPQKAREVYQEVFAKGSVADSPLTLRHKDGKLTDVLFNGSVYKDDRGNVLGVVIVARDITAQKAHELIIANKEIEFQDKEKGKRADELIIANKELAFQNKEKGKRADELIIANKELAFQDKEKGKRADELIIANKELVFQNEEKGKRADELIIANKELAFQDKEKGKRADELIIANKELVFQNEEKEKRADELIIANKELVFQNEEKEKRAAELIIANKELLFQNEEKEKRAAELNIANKELLFQNGEKEKRADELIIANKELAFQDKEKGKRADELIIANKELVFQNEEKEKRAAELIIANKELVFQNEEKGKRADELIIANKELVFQNEEKEKRAAELVIADIELDFQSKEKEKRAAELVIADIELDFQNKEKEKREIANKELEAFSYSLKLASQYSLSLIEASRDPLVTISPQGKITDMNQATVNITGMSREKLTGTDFFDYFTEPQKAREVYQEVFAKGSVADSPLTLRHMDGKLTDVLFNGSVYKDDRGNVLGVVIVARDVTAQKLLSKYSLSLIEASLDPLITISTEGKITDMNEALANITGMTREELTGSDFFDYFTVPQKAREVYQEVFAKGSVADSPLTLRHKDGKLTDVLFNGSVYKDDRGNVLGVVIVARDVTEQKRIATELTEAKDLAEKLAGAKDQFLASMSHEIRTPLNGIIGFTKILLRNEVTDIQKHQLDAIKTSSDILLVLINDILDLAKIEAGKMNIETTELKLSELVNSVLGTFELRFQEKELKINKQYDDHIPKILIGDPVRINQILLNLLSNSVKFTGNGGQISINVNLLKEDDVTSNIELIISDTGIGISPEKLEVIFQPFMQSSNDTARKYGGTGLGLSIVKQLVDLMGGTISVQSKLNKGSAFTITIPLKKTIATEISNDTETKVQSDDLKQLGKLKILLAEDIPINQFLAQIILHDFGFETDTAENGKIAIELLEKNNYDIILMDLMMPEMNGFEATQHIRNKMKSPKSTIPIIALTADVTKADVDKCSEVGMNEYVSKPINETDLLNKIARLVKRKKMQ
jgi:PAS domain S-box-containing protein